jgi:TIR domain/WD domain, G-beta repeat
MADIFISYARADKQFAKRLYVELQRFKVRGFMDDTDVSSGADLSRKIRDTVEHVHAVVVVLSENAAKSRWVMTEIGLAQSFNKPVIPVLAPDSSYDLSVPEQLMDAVVIDSNNQPLEITVAKIVAVITKTSVESALSEVQTGARRRQLLLLGVAAILALISAAAAVLGFVAFRQRDSAIKAQHVAEEQRMRIQELTGRSAALAVSPNGQIVATGSQDGSLRLWDINTGKTLSVLRDHLGIVSGMAFSPDGALLAGASWNGDVAVWAIPSGILFSRFTGHKDAIIGVAFGSDGKTLLSRSIDGAIQVWSIPAGKLIRTIEVPQ